MKETKVDGTADREVLAAMVWNRHVLGRISHRWTDGGLFGSPQANVLGTICVEFFRKHGKAPRRGLRTEAVMWAEDHTQDGQLAADVALLLENLPVLRTKDVNVEQMTDRAGRLFNHTKLKKLHRDLGACLDSNRIGRAWNKVAEATRLELGLGNAVDLFNDEAAVRSYCDKTHVEPLFRYKGALGEFFSNIMGRGKFVAFQAGEKVGKSHWLADVAYRAVRERLRTVFFAIGDMSEDQIGLRFLCRATRRPFDCPNPKGKWPAIVRFPTSIRREVSSGQWKTKCEFEEEEFTGSMSGDDAWKTCQTLTKARLCSEESYFKLSCHASIGVAGIKSLLEEWETHSWVPDVVVIDYADTLDPPPGRMEPRDQTNANWRKMRQLSLEKRCLLVTATQADADSYDRETQSKKNFSEDKRKYGHVTGMVGINITSQEKEEQAYHLNWLANRERKYNWRKPVYVGGCLDVCNPAMVSVWGDPAEYEDM